ncbi:FG-GAP-like repeat-containing protein [Flagellimonas sp.]|uniref:FG-GAP-like repeat-containing protein n=1 Tax=Flagellimonas sp. TaxID=2058762 RepID=UPI003B59607F
MRHLLLGILIFQIAQVFGQTNFKRTPVFDGTNEISFGDIDTGNLLGPGISFVDYNGDGWDDISIPASNVSDFQFLKNIGGFFEVDNLPITSGGIHARQITWVDFDNDGDNDFFAASDLGQCWFYRNDGGNNFTDILISSQIATEPLEYWGAAWGDYNNDGYLDLFLMVRSPAAGNHSLLYRNNGNGAFTDVTQSTGLSLEGKMTQSASFMDYDNDGFQDILLANDRGFIPNTLYRNNGDGTFEDRSVLSNFDFRMDGMSTTIEDYNNDGYLDIYITNIYPPTVETDVVGNVFLRNNGDGTFTNIAQSNGTRFDSFAWGAIFLDTENDGDLDLFVNGHLDGSDGRMSSAYYQNDGTGSYSIPNQNGFENDRSSSYGNAIGDIQNDGFPDMVVVNTNYEPINLWENTSTSQNNWLKIKLEGTVSNRMGIGSYIKIGVGDETYYRYTLCGEGYIGQNSTYEFVGLGPETSVDYIEVTWLSGIVDRVENVVANQALTIIEGSNAIEQDENHDYGYGPNVGDESVARLWNKVLLDAIRWDYARPTVHARNLFHTSMAMYDSWAIFNDTAETVFLGKTFGGYSCTFNGVSYPREVQKAVEEVMSYALYRIINYRFADSPGALPTSQITNQLFSSLGYDPNITDTDYSGGSYAALGNYLADQIINFGLQDGANESVGYTNLFYNPTNEPLDLSFYPDNVELNNPNRWQPLKFENFIDQSGNLIIGGTPEFLSPEWGAVIPFALKEKDLKMLNNGFDSYVYNDPGEPPAIISSSNDGIEDPYKWHFALVASWSSHLDPNDPTLMDISPAAIGNVDIMDFPSTFEEYRSFYDFLEGGDIGSGHSLNPITQQPYQPQIVKRADYARVLAEFWADGPDSETPPGHWFTILNYVSDHPESNKQLGGEGPELSNLEWDVKSYLALGGAMHDAAVSTWGIKGHYDYIRPISAIRYMASKGQSTDASLPNYHPHGLPLVPGRIELIQNGDPLAGASNENLNKIKILAWRGPDYIIDPTIDVSGVDWILGTQWWPYQRPTFVTPPFAGYVSGHSTFSRAAAEVLTLITGDPFFPGGMGVFDIEQNNFLVFESGPSENLTLQWATYRDASDQTSLSRIWGGIHPPIDDIPGRIIGDKIGKEAFELAQSYFQGFGQLSTDNFLIQINGETCVDQNNGSIAITAKDFYDYTVNLNDQPYSFNKDLIISDLEPGVYSLCIVVEGNNSAEQCYQVVVSEAKPNEVFTSRTDLGEKEKITIEIEGGTPPFTLEVNDVVQGKFENAHFEAIVNKGDIIEISSKFPCEGTYSEIIGNGRRNLVYTNPNSFEAVVHTQGISGQVPISIYGMHGQLIRSLTDKVKNDQLKIPIEGLPNGVYIVVLNDEHPISFKLIKE